MTRLALFALLIGGCATQPLTEAEKFEREYEYELTFQKWSACRQVYKDSRAIWFSEGHINQNGLDRGIWRPELLDMKFDLTRNHGCHKVLRALGYD